VSGAGSSASDASWRVVASARTSVGRQRSDNQDAFGMLRLGIGPPSEGAPGNEAAEDWGGFSPSARLDAGDPAILLVVADGMGGAAAGEVASRLAVSTVREVVGSRWREDRGAGAEGTPEELAGLLQSAAIEANDRIHEWSARHSEYRGMGSTLTAVGLVDRTAVLAQVGDSRAYLFREGRDLQLTEDQTMARKLVESGSMAPEEAEESSQSHMLLQALGTEPEVRPAVDSHPLRPDDRLLLCSDGLSDPLSSGEMREILRRAPEPERATEALVERANERGGPDNITVLLARVHFGPASDS